MGLPLPLSFSFFKAGSTNWFLHEWSPIALSFDHGVYVSYCFYAVVKEVIFVQLLLLSFYDVPLRFQWMVKWFLPYLLFQYHAHHPHANNSLAHSGTGHMTHQNQNSILSGQFNASQAHHFGHGISPDTSTHSVHTTQNPYVDLSNSVQQLQHQLLIQQQQQAQSQRSTHFTNSGEFIIHWLSASPNVTKKYMDGQGDHRSFCIRKLHIRIRNSFTQSCHDQLFIALRN